MKKAILVAGATGNLGNRICRELVKRGAAVSAMVRTSTGTEKIEALKSCTGIDCVVSALAGLGDVIVDLQKKILDGAIQADVPRFISSDFCTDYNSLVPGENRNFDLRREFKAYLNSTSIKASSIYLYPKTLPLKKVFCAGNGQWLLLQIHQTT